jgi:hypothetical protein
MHQMTALEYSNFITAMRSKWTNGLIQHNIDSVKQVLADNVAEVPANWQHHYVAVLVGNSLRYKTIIERMEVVQYAIGLGYAAEELLASLKPQQMQSTVKQTPAIINNVLTDDERAELVRQMLGISWAYNEQYADIMSAADKANIKQRDKMLSVLRNLALDELRKLYVAVPVQLRDVVAGVGAKKKQLIG